MPEKLHTIENSKSNVRVTVEKFHDNKWLLDQKNKVYEVIKKEGPLAEFMDKCLRVKKRISHENSKRVRTIELWGDGKILKNEWNIFWSKWAKELDNFENIKRENSDLFHQILARMEDEFLQLQKKEEEAKIIEFKRQSLSNFIKKYPIFKNVENKVNASFEENPELFSQFLEDVKAIGDNSLIIKRNHDGFQWFQNMFLDCLNKKDLSAENFEELYKQWKIFQYEEWRKEKNTERTAIKREKFIARYTQENPSFSMEEIENQLDQIQKMGTLTVEVFLDDILWNERYKKLSMQQSILDLFSQWEDEKINEIWLNIKSWGDYHVMLKKARDNGKSAKELAQKEKLWRNIKWETIEQLINEFGAVDDKWQNKDKQESWMLNTEQLICSAFVNFDSQDEKEFFHRIQSIGRIYFSKNTNEERRDVVLDGLRWPWTQAILIALKNKAQQWNADLKRILPHIDFILKNHKDYSEKAKKCAIQLEKDYVAWDFDYDNIGPVGEPRKEVVVDGNWRKVYDKTGENKSIADMYSNLHTNKHLDHSLKELSDEDIDISIPRNNYLEAIKKFLSVQNLPDELKFDAWLAEKILDNTWKGELFEEIQQLRKNSQTRAELLQQQRAMMQELVVNQAGVSAINVGKLLFQNFGIHVTFSTMKKNQSGQDYFECFDNKNPNLTYTFNPSTWDLGLQTIGWLDQQSKKISLNPDKEDFLAKIPTYYDLINQAVDVNSYLPQQRLNTEEELNDVLARGLQDKINYQVGEIEWATIAQNIEKKQKKDRILSLVKKLLSLDEKKELSLQEHKAFYEMLVPLLNTLEKANPQELTELQNFLQSIENYINQNASSAEGVSQKELDDNPILMVLAKKEVQKLLQEKGNTHHKSEFALWILFQMLEKNPEGASWSLEHKILDLDKIAFLNHTTGKAELEKNKQYWSRYRKTVNMVKLNYNTIAESQDKLQCESDCKLIEQQIWDMVMVN